MFKVEVIASNDESQAQIRMHVYCHNTIEYQTLLMQLNNTMQDWVAEHYPHITLLDKAISQETTPGILRHDSRLLGELSSGMSSNPSYSKGETRSEQE